MGFPKGADQRARSQNSSGVFPQTWSDSWAPQLTFQRSGQRGPLNLNLVLGNLSSKMASASPRLSGSLSGSSGLLLSQLSNLLKLSGNLQCLRAGEHCLLGETSEDHLIQRTLDIWPKALSMACWAMPMWSIVPRGHLSSSCKRQIPLGVSHLGFSPKASSPQDTQPCFAEIREWSVPILWLPRKVKWVILWLRLVQSFLNILEQTQASTAQPFSLWGAPVAMHSANGGKLWGYFLIIERWGCRSASHYILLKKWY